MDDFERAARLAGYTNFRREGGRYCHADLETFYKGWVKGRAVLSQQPECCKAQGVELEVRAHEDYRLADGSSQFYELVRLTDAQHLLSTERAEAERKMAEKDAEIERWKRTGKAGVENELLLVGQRTQLRARVAELSDLLSWLRGSIGCNPQNDIDKMGAWISTKHPMIQRIDAALNPPQANSQEGEKS